MSSTMTMIAASVVCVMTLGADAMSAQIMTENLRDYFRTHASLSDAEVLNISNGYVFVKEIRSSSASEIMFFGTVFIIASPDEYLALTQNVDSLGSLPNCEAIEEFATPPRLADLAEFTFDSRDIEDLRECVPGNCHVQMPAAEIERVQTSIDWSADNVTDQVNNLAQTMALETLLAYQQGGNSALGAYRDKKNPVLISEQFQRLVDAIKGLPVYLPEFKMYLLEYPNCRLSHVEEQFYWEKIRFGLRPTLRLIHAILYRNPDDGLSFVHAKKQIYSSHYFHTALELATCANAPDRDGFFLITITASEQGGLTGVKGSVVRDVAVKRTKESVENALAGLKKRLEQKS